MAPDRYYPSGRRNKTADPHSPWQRLVHARMVELDLSLRAVAEKVSTKASPLGHTRLYNWIRHVDGYPPKDSYSAEINARLARALELTPERLAEAYEASRKVFHTADPAPHALEVLRAVRARIERDKRKALTHAQVLKLLDDIEQGILDPHGVRGPKS